MTTFLRSPLQIRVMRIYFGDSPADFRVAIQLHDDRDNRILSSDTVA
jgi:hypothetical protein